MSVARAVGHPQNEHRDVVARLAALGAHGLFLHPVGDGVGPRAGALGQERGEPVLLQRPSPRSSITPSV